MKTILRFLGLALVFSAVLGMTAVYAAAQNSCGETEAIAALDAKIRENYSRPETLEIALAAAKQYLSKYAECEPKNFSAYLKENLAKWEEAVKNYKIRQKITKFDDAVKNKNFDEVYAVGPELVQIFPDSVTFMLPLGLIGLSESYRNNFKYNDDTIRYAKMALAKLKSGAAQPNKDNHGKVMLDAGGKPLFGPFQFERNAEDAISELTYTLAYILYHAKKDKRAGLLYYYEVSQLPGPYKQGPRLYATIAQYYQEESAPIVKEIVALIEKQKLATTDEEKEKLEIQIKPKVALFNGYNERAADALSRAYKFFDENIASEKAAKAQIYVKLAEMLGIESKNRAAFDKIVSDASAKPFPNPTSEVTPIPEPEPAKAADPTAPAKPTPTVGFPKGRSIKSKPASTRKRKP